MQSGHQAHVDLLKNNYSERSIKDAISKFAPTEDGNDVEGYTRDVARFSGLDMNRKIKDLSPDELETLTKSMTRREGTTDKNGNIRNPGTIIPAPPPAPAPADQSGDAGGGTGQTVAATVADADLDGYASDVLGADDPARMASMAYAADVPATPTLLTGLDPATDTAAPAPTEDLTTAAASDPANDNGLADGLYGSDGAVNSDAGLPAYASDILGTDDPAMMAPMAYAADVPASPTLLTGDLADVA